MKNIELLFDGVIAKNNKKTSNFNKEKLVINNKIFNSKSIFKIIEHLKWMVNLDKKNIKFQINCDIIGDDATLIIFESIVYYMIKMYNMSIRYAFNVKQNVIGYELYKLSNLYQYDNKIIDKEKFIKNYEKNLQINMHLYKKICINTLENREGPYLSKIYSDVSNFLKNNGLKKSYCDKMGETIIEILGNVMEHSDADAILQIKVVKGYKEKKECKFLTVTVVSFTKIKFGEKLKDYIFDNDNDYNDSNIIVKNAYNKQKAMFDNNYSIDNFVLISSFQKNVTTRKKSNGTGGTGLTVLINTLINSSLDDFCYIINGRSVLFLKKPYLQLREDGTIGFNDDNDYINDIPSDRVFKNAENCFNGTIHNLSFILEGGDYE